MQRGDRDRVQVNYSASFSAGWLLNGSGVMLELSVAGGRARSAVPLKTDYHLRLWIDVPRYETTLRIALAAVRWTKGEEFGLEFLKVEQEDRRRLLDLLRAIKATQPIVSLLLPLF
jgi:hypothetical protein